MSYTLRQFIFPNDYAAALELWRGTDGVNVGHSDTPEEIQKKLQRDPDLFLIAEVDRRMIGTIIGGYDGRRGLIYHLAVHADFRKQGIGAALLKEVEARLKAKGCLKCYLLILADNPDAVPFYEHHGWDEMTDCRLFAKKL